MNLTGCACPGVAAAAVALPLEVCQACSEWRPHTVRMHTRKVSVATITSQGWLAQNSPWLRNIYRQAKRASKNSRQR
jgi:hypothetical protein